MNNGFFAFLNSHPRQRRAAGLKVSRGQSLVELALTMPVLLLIVAGTVEVTNLITLYNEVQLASREGTRFAAQGGPDNSVMNVVNQATASTPIDPVSGQMNVWVIRPVLSVTPANCSGSGCTGWLWSGGSQTNWGVPETCVYPLDAGGNGACTGSNPVTPNKVGTDLTRVPNDSLDGERFAIVVIQYQAQTIMNLRFFGSPTGRIPVFAYTVMRQEVGSLASNQLTSGCTAYPIAIAASAILPPDIGEDDYFLVQRNNLTTKLDGFGFLAWRSLQDTSAYLINATPGGALPFPGNSKSSSNGFVDPVSGNSQLIRKNWVLASQSSNTVATARTVLSNLETIVGNNKPIAIRVIIYTYATGVSANPFYNTTLNKYMYQIANFAIVRIYDDSSNNLHPSATPAMTGDSIRFQFVRWDSSCGFPSS